MHPKVAKELDELSRENRRFRPSLATLIIELERDPKQYPKKSGVLRDLRAAPLRYRGTEAWRMVFRVDEDGRAVYVIALAAHDEAYEVAARRSRIRSVK